MGTALASPIPETQTVSSCRHCGGRIVQADGGRWWHAVAGVGPYLQCGLDAYNDNLLADPPLPPADQPVIQTARRAALVMRLTELSRGQISEVEGHGFLDEVVAAVVSTDRTDR